MGKLHAHVLMCLGVALPTSCMYAVVCVCLPVCAHTGVCALRVPMPGTLHPPVSMYLSGAFVF